MGEDRKSMLILYEYLFEGKDIIISQNFNYLDDDSFHIISEVSLSFSLYILMI